LIDEVRFASYLLVHQSLEIAKQPAHWRVRNNARADFVRNDDEMRTSRSGNETGDFLRGGKLEFLGGKPEFVTRGELDDVDMAMMIHSSSLPETAGVVDSNNGCIVKLIRYIGRAAHALEHVRLNLGGAHRHTIHLHPGVPAR